MMINIKYYDHHFIICLAMNSNPMLKHLREIYDKIEDPSSKNIVCIKMYNIMLDDDSLLSNNPELFNKLITEVLNSKNENPEIDTLKEKVKKKIGQIKKKV